MSYKLPTLNMVCGRAGTIHLTHESIQIDLLRSRFDSNEYSIVVNRFGANLTLKNSNVCSDNFLNNMRYRQQKRKSRGFGLKMCCNFYIILEIQSFHRSLITRYHNSSMKIAIINKKTGKFCTCELIQ